VFMLVKNKKYWFDLDAVRVPHKRPELNGKKGQIEKVVGGNELQSGFASKKGGWADYWKGVREYNPLRKNPGDIWQIPTQPFPEAHFATFPERLIEPMIKAGCPQWVCKKCGKARERITEDRKHIIATNVGCNKARDVYEKGRKGESESWALKTRWRTEHYTLGWTDCGCNAGWEAGIVLDPFMGAGTIAVVARKLGRNYIGIELNPKYIKIAERRIAKVPLYKRLNEYLLKESN